MTKSQLGNNSPVVYHNVMKEARELNLKAIVAQLKFCGFECQGGPLEKNVAFIELEKIAEREQTSMTMDIQAIRERCERATPGPWLDAVGCVYVGRPGRMIVDAQACENLDANTEFIAHARTDIPALLDEIERLQLENQWLTDAWNAAYGMGVRVEVDSVIGHVSAHWVEREARRLALGGDSHDN